MFFFCVGWVEDLCDPEDKAKLLGWRNCMGISCFIWKSDGLLSWCRESVLYEYSSLSLIYIIYTEDFHGLHKPYTLFIKSFRVQHS